LENDGTVLTSDLEERGSSGRTVVDIADVGNWLVGGEEENLQIMIDEGVINNVLEDNSENEQESSIPPIIHTI
jgi:hypothetical protein